MTPIMQFTNRLAHETSPYLLQHAHNPVDWYPWGEEAFTRARAENKPIFLSIGYAACHWCHVMERESFENEEVAHILNEHFISIKVDREERPDLDDIYMQAVQLLSGAGGWPMSVFLMPDGKPFFGGTYFPPEDSLGRIGFKNLLHAISRAYYEQTEKIHESSEALANAIAQSATPPAGQGPLDYTLLMSAVQQLKKRYDPSYGGFGEAPKFPPSMALDLLLRIYTLTCDEQLLEMVERTLKKMARGGIYDHLGGGFHRYSVDHFWLVPHFEKMLYDNALLAPVYFNASLVAENPFYEEVGRQILDYVLREMTDPEGGFYSTQDADSEGVEGKYYVWRYEEIAEVLSPEDADLFREHFDITPEGNWEEGHGASILNVRIPLKDFAMIKGMEPEPLRRRLDEMRQRLLEHRARRIPPLKDDKILTSWNGLMISAMARGAQVTGDPRYAEAATRAAQFILEHMRTPDGRLLRSWRRGEARINAFLEDYANLIVGLFDLYETTYDSYFLHEADGLARAMLDLFYDRKAGGFFTTDGRDSTLVARIKEFYDGASPSGNSSAVHGLLRLGQLLGREDYLEAAGQTMRLLSEQMVELPHGFHRMLAAVAFELAPPTQVAIIGKPDAAETKALLRVVQHEYLPHCVIAHGATDGSEGTLIDIALLENKPALMGRPTAYVCRNFTCQPPVHTPAELLDQLWL